jgi:hypothetical protein
MSLPIYNITLSSLGIKQTILQIIWTGMAGTCPKEKSLPYPLPQTRNTEFQANQLHQQLRNEIVYLPPTAAWKGGSLFPAYLPHFRAIPGGSRCPPSPTSSLERRKPIPSLPALLCSHSRRVSGSTSPIQQPGMEGVYSRLTCPTLEPFQEGLGVHLPQAAAWKGGRLFLVYLPHSGAIPGGSRGPPPPSCSRLLFTTCISENKSITRC